MEQAKPLIKKMIYERNEIESAVEWFKKEIKDENIKKLINKAFSI